MLSYVRPAPDRVQAPGSMLGAQQAVLRFKPVNAPVSSHSCSQLQQGQKVTDQCALPNGKLAAQVALHDMRNMKQALHIFEHHAEEVFQVCPVL